MFPMQLAMSMPVSKIAELVGEEELPYHNCNPSQINTISADMSPAFKKGVEKYFHWADMTFDKFHVIKLMNEAVDKVRREEQKVIPALKSTRYLWLLTPTNSMQ